MTDRGTVRAGTPVDESEQLPVLHAAELDSNRKLADRELRDSEELFRGLSVSCPVGIFRADLNGNVTYANPRTSDIWGMTEGELLGLGWTSRVHPDDLGVLVEGWVAASNADQNYSLEYRLLFPDGSLRWIHGRSAVVHDKDGRSTGTVGTVDDITDRRRFQKELQDAKEAAEQANRAKDFFLANVSHELRTPLNGVLGLTDVLLETPLTAEQRDLAETVRSSGQTLLNVVNDILDLSRIEAGKLRLEFAPFDLRKTVAKATALLRLQAKAKGLELAVDYPIAIGDIFVGDADRIQQILINYLTNAIKFTDSGSVTLQVRGEPADDGTVRLFLSVDDTGSGISETALQSLFRPFTQVDGSSTRRHGGVGLGLAISKRLAELMGGTVRATSTLGQGSTFYLQVNLTPAAALPGNDREQQHKGDVSEMTPGHVLLAEDNVINQKVATHLLRKLGWSVDVVVDGASAVERARQNKYALILMDCQMPNIDGYTATSMIRSYEAAQKGARTPIIAVTANAMAGDRARCLDAGMDDHIAKPLQLENLRCVLERWSRQVCPR
jgi:PAS domain S-box-containing protein